MNSREGGNSFPEAINEQKKAMDSKTRKEEAKCNCSRFCGKLPLEWQAPAIPPSPWMAEKGEGVGELWGVGGSFSKVSALQG